MEGRPEKPNKYPLFQPSPSFLGAVLAFGFLKLFRLLRVFAFSMEKREKLSDLAVGATPEERRLFRLTSYQTFFWPFWPLGGNVFLDFDPVRWFNVAVSRSTFRAVSPDSVISVFSDFRRFWKFAFTIELCYT